MFFQHLIDEEKEKSEKIAQEDQCQIVKRKKNQNASREARRDTKYSLELCSGEGRISSALKERGFKTVTLDNSNEKESDSSLSLEELETNIEDDTIFHDPLYTSTLGSDFDFIWVRYYHFSGFISKLIAISSHLIYFTCFFSSLLYEYLGSTGLSHLVLRCKPGLSK